MTVFPDLTKKAATGRALRRLAEHTSPIAISNMYRNKLNNLKIINAWFFRGKPQKTDIDLELNEYEASEDSDDDYNSNEKLMLQQAAKRRAKLNDEDEESEVCFLRLPSLFGELIYSEVSLYNKLLYKRFILYPFEINIYDSMLNSFIFDSYTTNLCNLREIIKHLGPRLYYYKYTKQPTIP